MNTAATAYEHLFNFHGVELRFSTSAQAFMTPVLTFLRHFHAEVVRGDTALTIYFEEVARDRKSTRLNSSHPRLSRMPSSA